MKCIHCYLKYLKRMHKVQEAWPHKCSVEDKEHELHWTAPHSRDRRTCSKKTWSCYSPLVQLALSNRSRELRDNVPHAWNISERFYCDRVPHPDWYARGFTPKKFCQRVVCLKRPCGPALPAARPPRARLLRCCLRESRWLRRPPLWHPSSHSLQQLASPTLRHLHTAF